MSGFVREYHDENYSDHVMYIPDCSGYGGKMQVTIRLGLGVDGPETPLSAYVSVHGDDVDGEEVFTHTFDVPLEWALAITGEKGNDDD